MSFDGDGRERSPRDALAAPAHDRGDDFARFAGAVAKRLEKGSMEYRERSFERPGDELLDEVLEELLDVCGWSYVLWTRLRRVRRTLQARP